MASNLPPPPFTLSEQDRNSALWLRLHEELTNRLDRARRKNDGPLSEQETARVRGEIHCLMTIISLGQDRSIKTGDEGPTPRF